MSQALLAADAGSVVTWGNAEFGADSSAMQTQLKNVQQIQASDGAFAAILDDGAKAQDWKQTHAESTCLCVCVLITAQQKQKCWPLSSTGFVHCAAVF